ncbi:hypothetical protein HMPREF3230_00141 [Gardnerella vaginalis]|uniref:Uncharacterized protein n=1 Tax=Gardnerella vaginalis TaxID=2702 RepID=A0A135ZBJ4_GARVA|nr:hypothetical protein HMPREF3230_00141 [Gardnerella vaginalis]
MLFRVISQKQKKKPAKMTGLKEKKSSTHFTHNMLIMPTMLIMLTRNTKHAKNFIYERLD